ncbi:conserved hypothetical protein [Nostocoides japonicum T1-X7]|uniref:DNA-binding protein n=1 Tax=Nostocoides japonicum T1-X7 TaxID=1194083 RepID=A0A077M4F3_9MICO|nr:OB-fold nucleic acid binding domain-containing protein [Tetrasphaera japonica]CCH79005.1 conserved hypothetical protein [Tetrasphaera japonica T1-X7]
MGAHGSVFDRWRDAVTKTSTELEADELQEDSTRAGGTPIRECDDRQVVDVCGSVRALTLPPRTSVPMLVAEIYDGTRPLNLVWLGRRSIGGIEPGTFLRAHGRVAKVKGMPTIYNPTYEILPHRGRA